MIVSTAFTEDPTSQVSLLIGGEEIKNVTSWVASQDCLLLGDPFSVTIPNPRGRYTKKLKVGDSVQLRLSNPAVNGGQPALTHTGLITERDVTSEMGSGSIIRLGCADRGWHLQNNCPSFLSGGHAHLLEKTTLKKLIQTFASNKTWGFADASGNVEIRTDDETSRLLRAGIPLTRAQAQATASDGLIIYRAIVEPGMAVADIIVSAAKRLNRFVGVSADGVLQIWTPNYAQTPLYRLDYHAPDDPDSVRNNILSARISDKLEGKFTRVECAGQVVGYYPTDPNDLTPGRFSDVAANPGIVPFDYELTYSDGEVWNPDNAPRAAQWRLDRALFDSFSATYKVRAHHQGGHFWAVGTMCELHDSVNGYDGVFFVSSAQQMRTRDGDQTEVTLRLANLLKPSFRRA